MTGLTYRSHARNRRGRPSAPRRSYRTYRWHPSPFPGTREEWLGAVADSFRGVFLALDAPLPRLRMSCGWPVGRPLGRKNRAVGQCWDVSCSADRTYEIFVSPCVADSSRAADILLHELVHTAVGLKAGHGKAFKRVAEGLGLEGPMTATVASEALSSRLRGRERLIGRYPHAVLDTRMVDVDGRKPTDPGYKGPSTSGPPKQSTRMVKLVCGSCGYTARTTRKWIEVGLPSCCCGAGNLEPEE